MRADQSISFQAMREKLAAVEPGDGAELRRPLGISIVGGLILSQLLTLYTTPVVYLYLDRARHGLRRRFSRRPAIAAWRSGS